MSSLSHRATGALLEIQGFSSLASIEMKTAEASIAIGLAVVATGVAGGFLHVPPALLSSSITQAFLLVMALVLFSYSPVVGIAAMALLAMLLYNRNFQKTVRWHRAAATVYGDENIVNEDVGAVQPFETTQDEPRDYTHFKDTYEGFQSGDDSVLGSYPLDEVRPSAEPVVDAYFYRPGADMGSDAFVREGPNIDNKMSSFAY